MQRHLIWNGFHQKQRERGKSNLSFLLSPLAEPWFSAWVNVTGNRCNDFLEDYFLYNNNSKKEECTKNEDEILHKDSLINLLLRLCSFFSSMKS